MRIADHQISQELASRRCNSLVGEPRVGFRLITRIVLIEAIGEFLSATSPSAIVSIIVLGLQNVRNVDIIAAV